MAAGAETRSGEFHDGKPEWCGQCDKRTRLIDRSGMPQRCACHPKSHLQLAQFKTCRKCGAPVYEWEMRAHLADIHAITGSNS